jgi:hypothetical protein
MSEKRLSKVYEKRICGCGETFWVPKHGATRRRRPVGIRPRNANTCWRCGKGRDRLVKIEKNINKQKLELLWA